MESLEREAVRNERGTPIREDPIPADRAGRRHEVRSAAELQATQCKSIGIFRRRYPKPEPWLSESNDWMDNLQKRDAAENRSGDN